MTEKRVIKMGNNSTFNEITIKDNGIYVQGNYYNNPPSQGDLTAIVEEINQLLTYFANNPPVNEAIAEANAIKERQPQIEEQEIVVEAIESSPTLKQRIHSAGKTLYLETIKAFLPAVGVAIETVNAFKNPE